MQIVCENIKNKTYLNENTRIVVSTLLEVDNLYIIDNVKESKYQKVFQKFNNKSGIYLIFKIKY